MSFNKKNLIMTYNHQAFMQQWKIVTMTTIVYSSKHPQEHLVNSWVTTLQSLVAMSLLTIPISESEKWRWFSR